MGIKTMVNMLFNALLNNIFTIVFNQKFQNMFLFLLTKLLTILKVHKNKQIVESENVFNFHTRKQICMFYCVILHNNKPFICKNCKQIHV